MTGRRLCPDEEAMHRGFGGTDCARRRQVLRETIAAFEKSDPPGCYHRLAKQNLGRWQSESRVLELSLQVQVFPGDWGDVTRSLTHTHGTCFAVLNMANAYVPGGAYVEGAIAQEENLFRRTDCHFRIGEDEAPLGSGRPSLLGRATPARLHSRGRGSIESRPRVLMAAGRPGVPILRASCGCARPS
jgi:hypothetical protein